MPNNNANHKRILSGITPSGDGTLHIGNYFGAVKQHIDSQNDTDTDRYFFIADYHALNLIKDSKEIERNIKNLALNYIALGIDPEKTVFYRQSDIPEVAELQTILNNVTPLGLIKRAHAYKDKLAKGADEESINMGLFCYPILMAADILLYNATTVPVGKDQKQHCEMARDIAELFNKTYGEVLTVPEPYIIDKVAVIVGTDGERKMSKTLDNVIGIFDDEATIRKQIFSTYTDPNRIKPTDPGVVEGNPVFIYHDLLNQNEAEVDDLKNRYRAGKVGDVEVKEKLFRAHLNYFKDVRERYAELKENPQEIDEILEKGKIEATKVARETLTKVRKAIGIDF